MDVVHNILWYTEVKSVNRNLLTILQSPLLTKEARMEPPIHELNLRSTVVLFAISFNRIL